MRTHLNGSSTLRWMALLAVASSGCSAPLGGGGGPGSGGATAGTGPSGCAVGGCSGQLCGEAGADLISTCEFREEYACYREATCERQSDGICGWTQTSELRACLSAVESR